MDTLCSQCPYTFVLLKPLFGLKNTADYFLGVFSLLVLLCPHLSKYI